MPPRGPPTFPKLPIGPDTVLGKAQPVSKPALIPQVLERIKFERAVSLEKYAKAHIKDVEHQETGNTQATLPGSPSTLASSQLPETPDAGSDLLISSLSSPHSPSSGSSKTSRKLKLFRKSSERSRSSSRATSAERSSHGGMHQILYVRRSRSYIFHPN